MDLKDIITDLGKTFEEFRAENDKRMKELEANRNDPLLAEKVDKINAEISKIDEMKKQVDALETVAGRGAFGGGHTELDQAKAEHKAAFEKWVRKGVDAGLRDLEFKADLSTLSDPDGGFLVPEEVETEIERVAETVSAMRRISKVMTIGTGTYKRLINKGGASSGWVGEKGSRTGTNTPDLVEIAINTKELYANPPATQTVLDDSTINIEQWLANEVAIEFNEQEADAFINGNGVERPKGIAAYSMVANASYAWGKVGYVASGEASAFTDADKLTDLQRVLKSVYRNGALFLMNDATQAHVRKFKDGEGNYLWRPGLAADAPNTLLGKPVEIDDNIDDIDTNKYPIFFGNFKRAYLIVDRTGLRVLRDPYTNKPYVNFYTTKRVGGGIVMYEALKALKVSA
jgi:HK97 family phage major capsid protein